MARIPNSNFVFKKNMSIGEADAENDHKFLKECFLDIGDYEILQDIENPKSIVIGRTGVGKSALLEQIEMDCERVIRIEPEALALRYISNSTILNFFEGLGVSLDIFYNLLWQHTLVVELIKNKYDIDSEKKQESFFSLLHSKLNGDKKKQQALKYIEEWQDKFWVDTETRIKEFTDKLEEKLKCSIDSKILDVKFTSEGSALLSEELKSEVKYYGKKVVSDVQIEKLAKIIKVLSEDIFVDHQQKTYILIDRLDENWVDDELRYKLIRALIETIKKLRKINPVKIIVTLRTDLLNRVLDKTKDSGFQREKYESLFLYVSWNKDQLKKLLDKRINHLLKYQYTNSQVFFDDVFPPKINTISSSEYILDRTLLRPRDAIMFVNTCLLESQEKTQITNSSIQLAEKKYSSDRINSLKDEWFVEHPYLDKYINIFVNRKKSFKVNTITENELEPLITELAGFPVENNDIVVKMANLYFYCNQINTNTYLIKFIQNILYVLYKIGIVGIKVDRASSVRWVHDRTQDLIPEKIELTSSVYIHKILWRTLAIDNR